MFVKCDSCNIKFEFKNPKKRKLTDQVSEIYFECPNCGEKFHSYYENEKVRKLIGKNKELQNKLKADITQAKYESLMKKVKYNKRKIGKEQKRIKNNLKGD